MMMTVAAILTLIAQDDWGQLHWRRDATPAEKGELQARLGKAYATIPELAGLGGRIQFSVAQERPVYYVVARTLLETRQLARIEQPLKTDGQRTARVRSIDVWSLKSPSVDGYVERELKIPIADSAQTVACRGCQGRKIQTCGDCRGQGQRACPDCRGLGMKICPRCNNRGDGQVCPECRGSGKQSYSGTPIPCAFCKGRGHMGCNECREGTPPCLACESKRLVTCGTCKETGLTPCAACGGFGKLLESLQVAIQIRPYKDEATFSALDAAVAAKIASPKATPAMAELEAIDKALARIPGQELRDALRTFSERARSVQGARVRSHRLEVLRVPCFYVRYQVDGAEFEAVVTPDAIFADKTPAKHWAQQQALKAQEALRAAGDKPSRKARELSGRAMKVDPECELALEVFKENQERLKLAPEIADSDSAKKPAASAPSPAAAPKTPAPVPDSDASSWVLYAIAGGGLVVVLGLVFVILRIRKSRRPALPPSFH